MVHALGFSTNLFNIRHPGRLCRGRERWIEPLRLDGKEESSADGDAPPKDAEVHRIVVSGAEFTDDSAADARRGLPFSGVDTAAVIAALFPRKTLLAFMEDGHPADIPNDAEGIEAYEGYRAGGRQQLGLVRWHKRISGVTAVRQMLGDDGPPDERIRGFALVDAGTDDDVLMERIFDLVGFSTLDSPPARYQPQAIPAVLEHTKAIVLIHRDKHGPALGIYATGTIPKLADKLAKLCGKEGSLLVPFAIPPMLARWDRALSELRTEWMQSKDEEFPVPPSPDPGPRDRRQRRGRRRQGEESTEEPRSDETDETEDPKVKGGEPEAPAKGRRGRKPRKTKSAPEDDASKDEADSTDEADRPKSTSKTKKQPASEAASASEASEE
ncbi:MAG: hypothetical protein KTR31_15890 [Myxococcales bacterium]|nr:hypothetical protein [Myxococcales bacterium]